MQDSDSTPSQTEGRLVGAVIGLVMVAVGLGPIVFKYWAHRCHLHNVYRLDFGERTWHAAVLCSGLFVGALGIALFLKATCGRWTWDKR